MKSMMRDRRRVAASGSTPTPREAEVQSRPPMRPRDVRPEGEAVAAEHPLDADHGDQDEALHQQVEDVLAAHQPAVEERQARRGHHQDQRRRHQHPGGVAACRSSGAGASSAQTRDAPTMTAPSRDGTSWRPTKAKRSCLELCEHTRIPPSVRSSAMSNGGAIPTAKSCLAGHKQFRSPRTPTRRRARQGRCLRHGQCLLPGHAGCREPGVPAAPDRAR